MLEALHLFVSKTCASRQRALKIGLLSGGRVLLSDAPVIL